MPTSHGCGSRLEVPLPPPGHSESTACQDADVYLRPLLDWVQAVGLCVEGVSCFGKVRHPKTPKTKATS